MMQHIIYIGTGLALTLGLLLGSITIGLVLGSVLAIMRDKGWMVFIINRYISIVRGTPVILQLSFFYFAIPNVTGMNLSVFWAGIFTLGLNSAAYIAEILRAGIGSIPKGQFEAAKAL